MSKTIGMRIAEQRAKLGLSQTELAKAVCTTRDVIAKWECDAREIKSGDVGRLADFFGVSCDYLIHGVSDKNKTVARELGLTDAAIESLAWFVEQKNARVLSLFSELIADWACVETIAEHIDGFVAQSQAYERLRAEQTAFLPEEESAALRKRQADAAMATAYHRLSAYEHARDFVEHMIKLRWKEARR